MELGLSQARLSALAGLSRSTINQLENGTLVDFGAAKLLGLLDLLGIEVDVAKRKGPTNALLALCQTASVSYQSAMAPEELSSALVSGGFPARNTPHVVTLLDEAPLSLIVAAVDEVAKAQSRAPKQLWKHLVNWAHTLQSPRRVWT